MIKTIGNNKYPFLSKKYGLNQIKDNTKVPKQKISRQCTILVALKSSQTDQI